MAMYLLLQTNLCGGRAVLSNADLVKDIHDCGGQDYACGSIKRSIKSGEFSIRIKTSTKKFRAMMMSPRRMVSLNGPACKVMMKLIRATIMELRAKFEIWVDASERSGS